MKQLPKMKTSHGQLLPLMDMIFLLLVLFIFMIVQMRPNFGIEVELPDVGEKSTNEHPDEQKTPLTISVTSKNKVYLNENTVPIAQLPEKVKGYAGKKTDEGIQIILRGDENADYGTIMEVFTTLRQHQWKDIYFDIEKKEKSP